ncbi:MAG TPA: hypothetical protein VK790_09035 [Solirubrobacteraceae bacterium]|nr:hypothetical protein [Solirubrobacteraceae bacterium]
MAKRIAPVWLHPDVAQALSLAVRLCAVAQLIGLLELALARAELARGGFLDWSMIGILSPRARTRVGSALRRAFRRLSARAFAGLMALEALVAGTLLAWPSRWPLIVAGAALQVVAMKRHHLTIDGSDQMVLVVLVTCGLGRVGAEAAATRAAVWFLAAELTLAYVVSGVYKAASTYWRSDGALAMLVQTRMYGQPRAARVVAAHPAVATAAGYAVFCWESLFFVALTAPPGVAAAMLALGLAFHAGCAIVMGLNRFVWAFAASYPAVLCTNAAIRSQLGAHAASTVAVVTAAAGVTCLVFVARPRAALSRA